MATKITNNPQPDLTPKRAWLRRSLNRLEIDQAVFYSLLTRGWQFLAGPVTLILIARHFSPETQGYFYTFAGLLGLQILFEMGLHTVIINIVSHEWAKLAWDRQAGLVGESNAKGRLISLGRTAVAWYGLASIVFGLAIGLGGAYFLARPDIETTLWLPQWMALVGVTALQLWTMPLVSILEGCNQVLAVNRMRAVQAIFGSLVVWGVIWSGGGLWAAVASAMVKLTCEAILIVGVYGNFFRCFVRRPAETGIHWISEVWPLQRSIACHSVLQYLAFFLFAPIMFHFHGPQVAGQMGMTWTILTTMQYAAFSWVQTRTPRFGVLIAQGNFRELDRLFFRVALISCSVLVLGTFLFWWLVVVLQELSHPGVQFLVHRWLPPGPTALFAASVVCIGAFQCLLSYLLAHKQNPLLMVSVVGNTLTILGVVAAGAQYGPTGAGTALLLVTVLWTLPAAIWVWQASRKQWHR